MKKLLTVISFAIILGSVANAGAMRFTYRHVVKPVGHAAVKAVKVAKRAVW